MADNLNPFEDTNIEDSSEDLEGSNDFTAEFVPPTFHVKVRPENTDISWDSIAAKLLRDNYILTALELYTEFIESGRDLPRLRDYFSNPGNFERTKEDTPSPTLPRTSSVQTFDSLDFARYSDDGERQVDERVAVLEFELRKAQETIRSLRASLTQQAETELSTPERENTSGLIGENTDTITPVEKKALNFLVNEYLLQADYKVTSVTFAEENEEQDFEDWDDVGLNIPRPPGLIHLFKDYSSHEAPRKEMADVGLQVDLDGTQAYEMEQEWRTRMEELESRIVPLNEQLRILTQENEILARQVDILKIGSTHESSLQTSLNIPHLRKPETENSISKTSAQTKNIPHNKVPSPENVSQSSLLEDSLEDLRSEEPELGSAGVDARALNSAIGEREEGEGQEEVDENGAGSTVDAGIVNVSAGDDSLRSRTTRNDSTRTLINEDISKQLNNRKMTDSFRQALLDVAFHVSADNRIVSEMSRIRHADEHGIVKMLARCLPHIVPNVLLAKREELIPVILCTAILHPDPKERDRLLNILFNLIKKPDDEQRQVILTGCVVFAEHAGADRLVEELLPQCWEQIGHKYVERRLLVAEACGALAPYLPAEIRSSLVLSMLQQMMTDDRDEDVREAVVKSLGLLMGFICDADKYTQGYDLLMTALKDPKEKVQRATLQVFLPALGMWSRELGRLEHHLMHNLLKHLEDTGAVTAQRANNSTSLPLNESRFLLLVKTLEELIPLLYLTVIETCPASVSDSEDVQVDITRFPRASNSLSDLVVMSGGEQALLHLVARFESHIDQEWFEPWEELNWIVNNLLPRILEVTMSVGLSMQKVVHALCQFTFLLCTTFGRTFTDKKIKFKFEELVKVQDKEFDAQVNQAHLPITTCIVAVYAKGVLTSFVTDENKSRLNQFLKRVLCTLALLQTSLDSLRAALIELSENPSNHELVLSVLWDGVVHSSALVRAAAASLFELMIRGVSDALVSSRVVPALVTLCNDQDITVGIATIPSLGVVIENITIREVLDRVYMQLQMFFDEPAYRDQHLVLVELIRTLARCGPSAEPKFRDEVILPRLAAIATANNHTTNETRRRDIAMQLFEAYSALSCCFLSEQVIAEAMLPGLRNLKVDMEVIAADHQEVVTAMIRDYQNKLEARVSGSTEDIKTTVMSKIKDTTSKANIGNIFARKK